MTHPTIAPQGQAFALARLVPAGGKQLPVLIPGERWFVNRGNAQRCADLFHHGAIVVLIEAPAGRWCSVEEVAHA